MNTQKTVKQAIKEKDSVLVFEFEEKKEFQAPWLSTEIFNTDEYGHIEIELESYFSADSGVDEDTSLTQAQELIWNHLLKCEIKDKEGK